LISVRCQSERMFLFLLAGRKFQIQFHLIAVMRPHKIITPII
jgi:hypothetical protein